MRASSGGDRLVRHGSILLAATVLTGIANFAFHLYMRPVLGPERYGDVYTLLSIVMIVAIPVGTIQAVLTKYIATFSAQAEAGRQTFVLFHILRRTLVCGAVAAGVFFVARDHIAAFYHISPSTPVVILGVLLAVTFITPVGIGVLQGLQRFAFLGSMFIIGAVLRLGLAILLVRSGYGVSGALAGSLLGGAMMLFIMTLPLVLSVRRQATVQPIAMRPLYKYSGPTLAALGAFAALAYMDVNLVKHFFQDAVQAGHYATAAMIGKSFLFPPMAFTGAMYPKVAHLLAHGKDPWHLLRKTLLLNSSMLLLGILICLFFPGLIMTVITRNRGVDEAAVLVTVPLLRVVGIAMFPVALSYTLIYYNLACHAKKFVYILVAGAALQLALTWLFHSTLLQVVLVMGTCGAAVLAALLVYSWRTRKRTAL